MDWRRELEFYGLAVSLACLIMTLFLLFLIWIKRYVTVYEDNMLILIGEIIALLVGLIALIRLVNERVEFWKRRK